MIFSAIDSQNKIDWTAAKNVTYGRFSNWPLQNPKSKTKKRLVLDLAEACNPVAQKQRENLNKENSITKRNCSISFVFSSRCSFSFVCATGLKKISLISHKLSSYLLTYLFNTNHIYDNSFRHYRSKRDWLECRRSVERAIAMPVCRSTSSSARRSISISVAVWADYWRVRSDWRSACKAVDRRHAIDSTHFSTNLKQLFLMRVFFGYRNSSKIFNRVENYLCESKRCPSSGRAVRCEAGRRDLRRAASLVRRLWETSRSRCVVLFCLRRRWFDVPRRRSMRRLRWSSNDWHRVTCWMSRVERAPACLASIDQTFDAACVDKRLFHRWKRFVYYWIYFVVVFVVVCYFSSCSC